MNQNYETTRRKHMGKSLQHGTRHQSTKAQETKVKIDE